MGEQHYREMRYNVQYVDKGGQLITGNVESHDVRAAIRELSINIPTPHASTNVLAEVDN